MSNFIVFSIILLIFIGGGYFQNKRNLTYEFFDHNHTTILKGIAILLVIWGHVGKVNSVGGIQFIAGAGVSIFLICSGYGLEMSYKKNGLDNYWKKRIVNVVIPFYVISILGYTLNNYMDLSISGYINILTFQSQWYISYLLVCYVLYYFTSKLLSDNKKKMIALALLFLVWFFVDTIIFTKEEAPFLRARQMGAFLSGVIIANYKVKSENYLKTWSFVFVNTILGLGLMYLTNTNVVKSLPVIVSNTLSLGTTVPLAYAIISFSNIYKRMFQNWNLYFVGIISYELFLVHSYSLNLVNRQLFLVPVFVIIVLGLSWFVYMARKRLTNKYKKA